MAATPSAATPARLRLPLHIRRETLGGDNVLLLPGLDSRGILGRFWTGTNMAPRVRLGNGQPAIVAGEVIPSLLPW